MSKFWRTSDNGFLFSPHEHNLHITCIPHPLYVLYNLPMIIYVREYLTITSEETFPRQVGNEI